MTNNNPNIIKIKDISYDEAMKCIPYKYLKRVKDTMHIQVKRWDEIRGREATVNYIDLDGKHAHEFSCGGMIVCVTIPDTVIHLRVCEHMAEIGDYHAWPTKD